MCKGRIWSNEDEEFLEENWGNMSIQRLAKKLGRTEIALQVKRKRLKICGATLAGEFVTAHQAATLMKIDNHIVIDRWIGKYGLKAKKENRTGKKLLWYIKMSDLIRWLKANQDKWDSRKVELYALGEEPAWLKEKRKSDRELPAIRFKKYSTEEDRIACSMYARGYTYEEISKRLSRSRSSVERRLKRIYFARRDKNERV